VLFIESRLEGAVRERKKEARKDFNFFDKHSEDAIVEKHIVSLFLI
jgi:hypothetical protein